MTPCTDKKMSANTFFLLLTQSGQAKTSDRTLHILTHPGRVPLLYGAGERDAANSLQREQMSNYWRHESWNTAKVLAILVGVNKLLNKVIRRWKQMVLLTTVRENTLCELYTSGFVFASQHKSFHANSPKLLQPTWFYWKKLQSFRNLKKISKL